MSAEKIKEFAKWCIRESCFDGCDLDGGSVQDKAVELGLLIETLYDPKIHLSDPEFEQGDRYYVFADEIKG
jgi:hypothetical protein